MAKLVDTTADNKVTNWWLGWCDSRSAWAAAIDHQHALVDTLSADEKAAFYKGDFRRADLDAATLAIDKNDAKSLRYQRLINRCEGRSPVLTAARAHMALVHSGEHDCASAPGLCDLAAAPLGAILRDLLPDLPEVMAREIRPLVCELPRIVVHSADRVQILLRPEDEASADVQGGAK